MGLDGLEKVAVLSLLKPNSKTGTHPSHVGKMYTLLLESMCFEQHSMPGASAQH